MMKKGDEELFELKYLNTKHSPIYRNTILDHWFTATIKNSILIQLGEFQQRDLRWALSTIVNLSININKFITYWALHSSNFNNKNVHDAFLHVL